MGTNLEPTSHPCSKAPYLNRKLKLSFVAAILALGLAGVLYAVYYRTAQQAPAGLRAEGFTKRHSGEGGVSIEVTFMAPAYFQAFSNPSEAQKYELQKYLVFRISLDTHSIDLSKYDMRKITFLRDDKGYLYSAVLWIPQSDDSHHRAGIITFPRGDPQGNSIIDQRTRYIEIVVRDVAGVSERVLRWDLPFQYLTAATLFVVTMSHATSTLLDDGPSSGSKQAILG